MTKTNNIRVLDRALDVIEAFSFKNPELSLAEIAEQTNLPSATVYRVILTLINRGYLEKDSSSGKYKLGMGFVKVGGTVIQTLDLVKIATPHLQKLAKLTELNVNLSVLYKGDALCLVNIESFHKFGYEIKVGERLPIYAGALSKSILAFLSDEEIKSYLSSPLQVFTPRTIAKREQLIEELDEIRKRGYSQSFGELTLDVTAYACPIFNYENKVVGGVSISGPDYFFNEESNLLGELENTASTISEELGY
ncbi:IclR family transcriptional regulator [Bacillus tianshenii]|nr:IclR family transcriptional regulator [Bacillus tianshenii]